MLVIVVVVLGVLVPVVYVIDMIAMLNGLVAAVGTVAVLGCRVLGNSVGLGCSHGDSFSFLGLRMVAQEWSSTGSCTWTSASSMTWETWSSASRYVTSLPCRDAVTKAA